MNHARKTLRRLALALPASLLLASVAAADTTPPAPIPETAPSAPETAPPEVTLEMPMSDGVDNIRVEADRFETVADPSGGRTVSATGNARATISGRRAGAAEPEQAVIHADALTANLAGKTLTARGNVVIVTPEGAVNADTLEYRWEEAAGRAVNVEFRQYGLTFQAGSLDVSRRRQVARNVRFSTCGLEDPDFLISARRIVIVPNNRIEARGVSLALFGRRVGRVPRMVYRIGAGRAQTRQALPMALPGYSRASGFTLTQPLPLGREVDAEIEPTTRAGLRGRAWYEPERQPRFYAGLSWKKEESVRDRKPVLVSRMPEAGLRATPSFPLNLSAGYYREHDTGARAGRVNMDWERDLVDRHGQPGLSLSVRGRVSAYTGGEVYRHVMAEVSVGRGGDDTFEEAGLRLNDVGGDTPFLWDSVQVRTEAFAAKRVALGNYRVEGGLRYDLDEERVYDVQVAVARRFQCLEPEIRYSSRSQGFSIGIRVFGIGVREDPAELSRPREPQPAQ